MKKYLITERQLKNTQALLRWLVCAQCLKTSHQVQTSADLIAALDALKPIEPLSDDEIGEILDASYYPELSSSTLHPDMYDLAIARAIERHITGLPE